MMFAIVLAGQLAAAPVASVPAPTFDAARNLAVTPGQWTYAATPTGSESRFATNFSIRCDRTTRLVTLRRIEPVVAAPAGPLTIVTDSTSRTLAAGGANLRAQDPLLDAIAFSRGRFIVSGGGGATLVLPAWPEAARSIENCRN